MDMSSSLAKRICQDVHERSGGKGFKDDLFKVFGKRGNSFNVWKGVNVEVIDSGTLIELRLSNGDRDLESVVNAFNGFKVPGKYSGVVSSVSAAVPDGENYVSVCVRYRPRDNSDGRVQNEDKLYHSFMNCAVKPALGSVLSL